MRARRRASVPSQTATRPAAQRVQRQCAECEEQKIARQAAPGGAGGSFADTTLLPPPTEGRRREAGESAAEPGAVGGLVVEDEASPTGGQMRKSELLELLRVEGCAAADREMAAAGRDTDGCPYVEKWLGYYAERPAAQMERAIRKFAPGADAARTARDYVPLVSARIARGVRTWVVTGALPDDLPDELRAQALGGGLLGALGGALASIGSALGGLFFQEGPGGAATGVDRTALNARLGPGRPLDGGARVRMEGAFGYSFTRVRVHDDAGAAALSRELGAHAFTLGEHVAFADGRYRPGTPIGDALLAHELAHVVQQQGAPQAGALAVSEPHDTFEQDADRAAAGALRSLYAERDDPDRRPQQRSGLRLARCSPKPPEVKPPVAVAAATSLTQITVDPKSFKDTKDLDAFKNMISSELKAVTGLDVSFSGNALAVSSAKPTGGSATARMVLQLAVSNPKPIVLDPATAVSGGAAQPGRIAISTTTPAMPLKALRPGIIVIHEMAHQYAGELKPANYEADIAAAKARDEKGTATPDDLEKLAWYRSGKDRIADENIAVGVEQKVQSELGVAQRQHYIVPLEFPPGTVKNFSVFKWGSTFIYLDAATYDLYTSTHDYFIDFAKAKKPVPADPADFKAVVKGSPEYEAIKSQIL